MRHDVFNIIQCSRTATRLQSSPLAQSVLAENRKCCLSVLLLSTGYVIRTQLRVSYAIINKNVKDKDLNKLLSLLVTLMPSCHCDRCHSVQSDTECPTPLYPTPLGPGSLELTQRLLHVQVNY